MIFKWVEGECFLSVGEEKIRIDFEKLGKIVVVKGQNLDVSPLSSNAAGKSTLVEMIVYALFGKLIKELAHKEAINKKIKKGLLVQVAFELDGHLYRVVRGRKPDKLEFYRGDENITLGGMPATQQLIESTIRLNYDSFVNIACFGEHNNHAFLSCDAQTKRSIVENLLGLEKYVKYCKAAKETRTALTNQLVVLKKDYEGLVEQRDRCDRQIAQLEQKRTGWRATKKSEIEQATRLLDDKERELAATDDGVLLVAYQEAQGRIAKCKDELVKSETQRAQILTLVEEVRAKETTVQDARTAAGGELRDAESRLSIKRSELAAVRSQIASLKGLKPGVKCDACHGTVDQSNYHNLLVHSTNLSSGLSEQVSGLETEVAGLRVKLTEVDAKLTKIRDGRKAADAKVSQIGERTNQLLGMIQRDSRVEQPQVGAKELVLREQISELKNRVASKRDELDRFDPYADILRTTVEERDRKGAALDAVRVEVAGVEGEVPYYDYWIDGFGDNGIRAFVIDDTLPALNARINYWLQFLIENKLQLHFDNKFEATIQRNPPDGDPFVYNATSGGERRRINISISQAFGYCTMLSAGTVPSFVSLDEVALNVDVPGVHGIYAMINELSRDRQVFVTTHDPNLSDLLAACDTLTVVKKDGFSTIPALATK